MLRHFINTIDYAKLIEMQANQTQTIVSRKESKNLRYNSKSKMKNYSKYNSVNRHR